MIIEQKTRLAQSPNDPSTLAVLTALYSTTDNPPPHSLPPISTYTEGINVAALEAQGIPSSATAPLTRKPRAVARPRKRRVRGGKEFDSSVAVDPERWLPLRERSYYKPLKGKRREVGGGAAQGSAGEGETMSRNGSAHQVEKASSGPAKKKKKGKK
jgi:signal recognition particle subunit SRP72